MPEWSARGLVDNEVEIKVSIKHAQCGMEENYKSTLHVLNTDLKSAIDELA